MLAVGARKVIVGSALIRDLNVNTEFAQELANAIGIEKVIAALDSRGGKVAIGGWREQSTISTITLMRAVESYCGGFLYTHIDTEGLMAGIPVEVVRELKQATSRQLIVAGGIRSQEEVDSMHEMGVDAVVGMAIYTGAMKA
jgi:phosphoribosylformimino-5-aminoimidazole carboxamide ribotide isomerase